MLTRMLRATFLLILLALAHFRAAAASWTVTSTADGGIGSLRQAVVNAASGDTIQFQFATTPATIFLTSGDLQINQSLTITGLGAAKLIIDGSNNPAKGRVLTIGSGVTVSISGLTVQNGRGGGSGLGSVDGDGGGIYNSGNLTLTNVVVSNNHAANFDVGGGGILNTGTLVLVGSTVSGNTAGSTSGLGTGTNGAVTGGAIRNAATGTLTVTDSTISNNFGQLGGGIFNTGSMSVTGSTFASNTAGVGISSTQTLVGGAIYVHAPASGTVVNSTFYGNSAKDNGGAIANDGTLSVSFSTFSGNSATSGNSVSATHNTLTLKANIFSNNGANCFISGGNIVSDGFNLATDGSCNMTATGDLPNTSAGLDPSGLQNNGGSTQTIALLSTSAAVDKIATPCTDAGGNSVMTDQRDTSRPQGTSCDIGAFELDQSSTLVVSNTNDSGAGSLRQAIADANADANPSDTITFNLTYPATITLTSGVLTIEKNLTIRGPGASSLAISGGSSSSCIINPNGIKECTPPSGGSQIFDIVSGVSASITSVTLQNGNNDNGGAVVNYGTLNLGDCVVTQNQSIQGAGLNNQSTGMLVVTNCTVSGNTASGIGGGLANFGTATITTSTFSGNNALEAGGAFNGGTLTVVNSTFADNRGTTAEGAIGNDSTLNVSNSTFNNNSSGSAAIPGALYNFSGGTSTVKGTLLAKGSLGGDCASSTGTIASLGHNLADDSSCTPYFTDPTDQNNTPAGLDPNDLQDNGGPTKTVALLASSTAVDAIPPDSCTDVAANAITVDQRGVSRPQGSGCDIGAFELKLVASATTVTSTLNPSTYGAGVTFTAAVAPQSGSGSPTGTVTFYDGTTSLGSSPLSSGQAVLSTAALIGGSHSITATYNGDGNLASSTSAPLMQTVNPASTSTTLISSLNPSTYGSSVSFTATVSSTVTGTQTGTVTFYDGMNSLGSVSLSSGQAILSTSALTGGSHTITATYNGDINFATSTSVGVSQTVNRASTSTTVASSVNPSVYGQPVSITATVSSTAGTPTGTVSFVQLSPLINFGTANLNASGKAILTTSALTAGVHTIIVSYGGDTNFVNSGTSISQTVNKASTLTTLMASPNPATTLQTVSFVAHVAGLYGGAVSGTVTFMEGAMKVLGTAAIQNNCPPGLLCQPDYSATLSLSLGQGSHTVTAIYAGDTNDTGSASSAVTEIVNPPQATATTVSSSLNPAYVGQAVTFTATVTPPQATGTVTFMQGQNNLGTAALSSGQASFSISLLPAGNLTIVAVYSGDGQYAGSTSSNLLQAVNKASTTTIVGVSPNPSLNGIVTLGAQVLLGSPNGGISPRGTVTFVVGSTVIGSATLNSNGIATLAHTFPVGKFNIKAVYGGSNACLGSTSTAVTLTAY